MRNYTYYAREILGYPVDFPEDMIQKFAKAQLIIAGADGLSAPELEECHGLGRVFGATDETIAAIEKFDFRKANFEESFPPEIKAYARQFIYFAVRICSADNEYSQEERAHVRKAATFMGVGEDVVKTIEGIVAAEQGLRAARIAILSAGM